MKEVTKELLKLHREHIKKLKLAQKYFEEVYRDRGWARPNLGLISMFEEDIRDIKKDIKRIQDIEKKELRESLKTKEKSVTKANIQKQCDGQKTLGF